MTDAAANSAPPERGPWLLVWAVAPLRIPLRRVEPDPMFYHADPRDHYTTFDTKEAAEAARGTDPHPDEIEVWDKTAWEDYLTARRTRRRPPKTTRKEAD